MKFKRYKDYIILQEPQRYSRADYETVKNKIINMFKSHSDVISIYQIGSVSTPGISDLDLTLVFDDRKQRIDFRNYYNKLDGRDQYILMHGLFIITKNLFENMRYFYIPGDFKLLWGEQLEIKPVEQIKLLEQLIVTEFILGLFFTILRALDTKVIKIRSLLCELSALKYDLEILGLNKNNFSDGRRLVDSISQLRQGWFELSENARVGEFIACLIKFPDMLFDILTFIEKKLTDFNLEFCNKSTNSFKCGINRYVLKSTNIKCDFIVKKNYFASLLEKLPYSKLTDDTTWVLSDYIIKIPCRLLSLLSGNVNSNFKSIFKYRDNLIKSYLLFYKQITGFGMLLPTLRAPLPILNLKWQGLIALRRLRGK